MAGKCEYRTQLVCNFVGHINRTKSHDRLFASYFIHCDLRFLILDSTAQPTLALSQSYLPLRPTKEPNVTKRQTTQPTKNR